MSLTDRITAMLITGAMAIGGCATLGEVLKPVKDVRTPKKYVEFYDVNKDGKIDKIKSYFLKPNKEYIFEEVPFGELIKCSKILYTASDTDFIGGWDELRYFARDVDTGNVVNCKFLDRDDNGVYETGFLNIFVKRYSKNWKFELGDTNADEWLDWCTWQGKEIKNPMLIGDFNLILRKLKRYLKEDSKRIKD